MKQWVYNLNLSLLSWILIPGLILYLTLGYLNAGTAGAADDNGIYLHRQLSEDALQYVVKKPVITDFKWNGQALVTFWLDDAWLSQYDTAWPILEKYGYTAAIAVPTTYADYGGYANWFQIRELQASGWEVTSHSLTHVCNYGQFFGDKLEDEFRQSKHDLITEGLRHEQYVSPCGVVTPEIRALAEKYYQSMRTADADTNLLPLKDKYAIKAVTIDSSTSVQTVERWLDRAEEEGSWVVLLFHQVDKSKDFYAVSPEKFEQIVKVVKQRRLTVVLPSQVINLSYAN